MFLKIPLVGILWHDRKSLFLFITFLTYLTFWDSLNQPKIIIFQYI